jgi:hypothetical protein
MNIYLDMFKAEQELREREAARQRLVAEARRLRKNAR